MAKKNKETILNDYVGSDEILESERKRAERKIMIETEIKRRGKIVRRIKRSAINEKELEPCAAGTEEVFE